MDNSEHADNSPPSPMRSLPVKGRESFILNTMDAEDWLVKHLASATIAPDESVEETETPTTIASLIGVSCVNCHDSKT